MPDGMSRPKLVNAHSESGASINANIYVKTGDGWYFGDHLNHSGPKPRSEMLAELALTLEGFCENCGRELRRTEAGVCSDCHENRRVADVDDDAFEAAREKAGEA